MNELMIPLDTKSLTPLYQQIEEYLKQEIQEGRLVAGMRLPSSRALSANLLVSRSTIETAYDQLVMSTFDSICPVVAFSYPILRSLSIDEKGNLNMNWPEYRFSRSQDLRPAYHDSGTFYWIKTSLY